MDEAADRIERHIDAERQKLDWDLQQIERKLRVETRWLQRNSVILGVAVVSFIPQSSKSYERTSYLHSILTFEDVYGVG